VPWWTSLAVAFFALALVFAAIVGVIGFIRVRRFAGASEGIAAALDELSGRTVEVEERLARLDERSVEIERAAERVNRSLERLSVLTWALGDARKGIARIRAVARK
jgi:cell division protein FtsB